MRLDASSRQTSSIIYILWRLIDGAPDYYWSCVLRWCDHSYDALPSVRIRQFGSILPWAWPLVPCHTLGSIRDHYGFVFNMHKRDASLATVVQVVL